MLSKNAITVLTERYFEKDKDGNVIEDGPKMFHRVARFIAEVDKLYGATAEQVQETARRFFDLTYSLDFLPNSPTLANAGTRTGQLSACFVLPVGDSLVDIFDAVKWAALVHKTGGGTGFSFSRLRQRNGIVGSTCGVSSGPVSFMDAFNAATETIKQGSMRRGANMGILRIDHPDILEFISHKEDLSKLTNFNISVAVTNEFMKAVDEKRNYDLIDPNTKTVVGQLYAPDVFKNIVQRAWNTGEPGLVFIDRMNEYNPVPFMGEYEATNPCGEQPLIPFESCNLGSINLERFVIEHYGSGDAPTMAPVGYTVDWNRLRETIFTVTHYMDNVIDANAYVPDVPQIAEVSLKTRKLGIGFMGFARMLFKLGIRYGSPESLKLARELMSFLDYNSKVASVELAKVRGAYPAFNENRAESLKFFGKICDERNNASDAHNDCDYDGLLSDIITFGIRNSNTTTNAPTGTLSIIADTSGGVEPVFALAFKRWQAGHNMIDSDNVFKTALSERLDSLDVNSVMSAVDAAHGSLIELCENEDFGSAWEPGTQAFLSDLASVFVTSHDIPPSEHVDIQAAFQAFNDSAISKTINFPESATVEDVETAYIRAWETGCKGITIYRNNSRQFQPLSVKDTAKNEEGKAGDETTEVVVQQRPAVDAFEDVVKELARLWPENKVFNRAVFRLEKTPSVVFTAEYNFEITDEGTLEIGNSPYGGIKDALEYNPCPNCGNPGFDSCSLCENCGHAGSCSIR